MWGNMSGFPSIIDLSSFLFSINEGFKIQGDAAGDLLGQSVSNAGDVNGDGYDDFIVGAPNNDFGGSNAGQAYVIFGQAGGAAGLSDIDLSSLTSAQGFTITGDAAGDQAGYSVSSAGDINGDGFDDILVGAPFGDNGGSDAGEAYLIYGKASGFSDIDLTSFTAADGIIFQGLSSGDDAGWSVSSAGDINGDGRDDILIGVRNADSGPDSGVGKVYVYFGNTIYNASNTSGLVRTLDDTDPNQVASGISFSITGDAAGDSLGWDVSSAGDVNGDGYDDIIVGAPGGDNGGSSAGEAYVIFGKATGFSNIDLSSFSATDGFTIQGDAVGDDAGVSVASAGDVNADGIDDLIISARYNDDGATDAGAAYVLFGKSSGLGDIDLSTFGLIDGFTIQGAAALDFAGWSVAGGGDFNGDGYDDVIVGALTNDDGGSSVGAAYVIFGKDSGFADIDLSSLSSSDGFVIQGAATGDLAGRSVSNAGDTNGDGFDDILVGASSTDAGGTNAGEAYIILGRPDPGQDFPFRLDLSTVSEVGGFTVQGEATFDASGGDVSSLGDINADGFDDFIIGADGEDSGGNLAGAAYVLFGQSSGLTDINLTALTPSDGFKIQGDAAIDLLGESVSSAGDINGDGFDDILIGAPFNDANGSFGGSAYVLFGKATAFTNLDLSSLTIQDGFAITAANAGDMIGSAISSAGDINGDGFDDILVSTPFARNFDIFDADSGDSAGASYVIYGKANGFGDVDLFNLSASDGISILGAASNAGTGASISSAGDFNGDGFDDFIIGAQNPNDSNDIAQAYVIFGTSLGPSNIDLGALSSSEGFGINNILSFDYEGPALASLGDINGDGFDDIAIGAIGNASIPSNASGQVHVIFGKAIGFSTLDVTSLAASDGFVIQGENISDQLGSDVSAAGDINGDGFDDFIMSASQNDIAGNSSGAAYVIYGKASGLGDIDLNLLTAEDGFIIEGDKAGDALGAVSGAGDVNGDGFDDLLVGAPSNDDSNANAGESYIIFGRGPEIAVTRDGSAADQTILGSNLNDTLRGFGGDDILLGRSGGDAIYGGSGNDILQGASGFDALYGEGGDDNFFVLGSLGDSDSVDGGIGIDTLYLASADNNGDYSAASTVDWEVNLDTGSGTTVGLFFNASVTLLNVENIVGGDGDDVLTGDNFNNVFEGGAGIDTLLGGDGDDSLTGGAGSDILIGGDGNDMIFADTADNFVNVTGGGGVDALHLLSETAVSYDFAANGFETAEVRNLADTLIQRFTTAVNGDTELTTYDIDDSQNWSFNAVRTDISGTQSYESLTLFYRDGTDALDIVVNQLDSGNRVTTDYNSDGAEDFALSIFTEDLNNDELFTSVLQLRNSSNEVTRFINTYDNDLEVTIDFEFSTIGSEATSLFDIVDNADWNRAVLNVDNSAGNTLLNYQTANIYQTASLDNYGSIVVDDDGVRIVTDNDLDGSDSWASQITKTDDDDSFTWGTIIDQRDASGNILYLSQTNEGSYDTIDVFDVAGTEAWARTVTFVDDEGDFSWATLTFFYDDMGVIYDTAEVPDGM